MNSSSNCQYEVLNPWAEVDPVPLKGAAQRLTDLDGKKIGLLCNFKIAARPILTVVQDKLKKRFPKTEFSYYVCLHPNLPEVEGDHKDEFEEWLKGIDGAIGAVGD